LWYLRRSSNLAGSPLVVLRLPQRLRLRYALALQTSQAHVSLGRQLLAHWHLPSLPEQMLDWLVQPMLQEQQTLLVQRH
jgi:hypothetical protein